MREIEKYPVYRALYQPTRFLGVPLAAFMIEIIALVLICTLRLWLLLLLLLGIHIGIVIALKYDPFILEILMNLASTKEEEYE